MRHRAEQGRNSARRAVGARGGDRDPGDRSPGIRDPGDRYLVVGKVSLELITALRPVVVRIRRRDRALADQLVRAANSVALNIAEADYSNPGNKRLRLFTAAGSASEVRAAMQVAVEWGYCPTGAIDGANTLVDRTIAMLWRLTRR